MRYLAQVRTKRFDDSWTHWQSVGDPMTEGEADEWLSFDHVVEAYEKSKPRKQLIEFRLITVPDDWPTVFKPRLVRS